MSFEAGPANPAPFTGIIHTVPSVDLIDVLASAPAGAGRLRALRQHVSDKHALTVQFADIQEAAAARLQADRQLARLLAARSLDGFNLDPTDARVGLAEQHLAKLTADLQRLKELDEVRSAAWRAASAVLVNNETWLRSGRPSGTVLHDWDGEVPKLAKDESVTDAIERLRRRVRELKADAHRIRSACFPSAYCKSQMRQQIEQLAMQGAPDVAGLLEHDRRIIFPSRQAQTSVINAEIPTLAFIEIDASIPFVIWLHRDELIKKLDAEIDAEADDKAALTHDARKQQEAVVLGDLLVVERDEAALVWRGIGEGLSVDHRADCAPEAILQVVSVVAPRIGGNGHLR